MFGSTGDSEPNELIGLLDRIALIAIRFSTVNDGRGLSIAVILRTRLGFKGELRAIGEVHEDVLHYMRRCGIDSYELPGRTRPVRGARRVETVHRVLPGVCRRSTSRISPHRPRWKIPLNGVAGSSLLP